MVNCNQSCSLSEERLIGLQPEGLLCILQKEALSEMDTWLKEHFAFAPSASVPSLASCSTPKPLDNHWKEQCMLGSHVGCCVSVGQWRRGGGMTVLQL